MPDPTPVQTIADHLDAALREAGTPDRAVNEKAYLKSPLTHYGVRVPVIHKTVKTLLRHHGPLERTTLLNLVETLWEEPVHELHMAAVIVLEASVRKLEAADLDVVEGLLRDAFTWAYVDTLAANVAGPLVERYPDLNDTLDRWIEDDTFWIRRAALLALLGPLRRGDGDWDRFTRYADALLHEKEFFIRKAIGWVLREASKKQPRRVYHYLHDRLDRVAGLTLREGSRHLPEPDRTALLQAYKAR